VPGIGPWTADYVALRVFGDPDAFPAGDLIVRRQAERLGLPGTEKALLAHAEAWRPWRAYAALHLWASAGDPVTEGTEQ
jgi:AraC family transcriptional regulator of adaptative response / DNA-3-methyladenine glycosylase II